jgi:hypothetical protein
MSNMNLRKETDRNQAPGGGSAKHTIAPLIVTLVCTGLLLGDPFMYWDSNFGPIALANITSKSQVCEGSSSTSLCTNGDAEISADNSVATQLSCGTDTLVTEYKLTFDGDGSSATGSTDTDYEAYDQFLTTAASVTHIPGDDEVLVTLHVRASNYANDVADAGSYTAIQTLTVYWCGP